jgi:hypothetical protein
MIRVPLSSLDLEVPAEIPAVLAEMVSDSGLDESELAAVKNLAEEFVAKVADGPQEPDDPVRRRRWSEAQIESDLQMRQRYGSHAWLKFHVEAYRQATANSSASSVPAAEPTAPVPAK